MIARAQGRIVAIAPLLWERTWVYGVPVRRLRTLNNDHTPRIDFIVAERVEESYAAIWQALRHRARDWDLIQLDQIPVESPSLGRLKALARRDRCPFEVRHGERSPYLTLYGAWDGYVDSIGSKLRQSLRSRLARLSQSAGSVRLEVVHAGPELQEARRDAFRLEGSGWKEIAGTAIVSNPAVERFYSAIVERASGRGWLELQFLTVGVRRIAAALVARYHGRTFLVKTGYDPRYAKYAPCKLLTYLTLRDAHASGLVEVDFMGDAEPWKLEWTKDTRSHDWLFIFSNHCRSHFLRFLKLHRAPTLERLHARLPAHVMSRPLQRLG
jgi:CelD/BcsL family acetyltransferase involved in cellulose biosynthesis